MDQAMICQLSTIALSLEIRTLSTLLYHTLVTERDRSPWRGELIIWKIVITNINTNKVNEIVDNELIFDSSNSLSHNPVQDPLPIVTIILRFSKNSRQTLN